ncbi:biopolymer transporter ExbD [Enterovibrio makurazakiensis]|uniref:Biopolymer transporter ExbD n=1 Tax=Enterovibrio gelatinilyticus TaxID=2899819 RepID=A0ABT5QW61_9GAMM|nr:biopolymer transporter ExbD [Enterovibrio sp. ZSDZ42]MDD1792260.1 biopolymer transporter ExbD [Enterovibrio sp. ZSDZ42]
MIRSRSDSEISTFTPDLTPLLDIIFIVMVFLLLTANVEFKSMEIAIPQTQDSGVLASPEQQMIAINILADSPAWAIQGQPIDNWPSFTQTLLETIEANPNKTVVIAADKSAAVEDMLKVLAFMQQNQITATNIVMEEE